MGYTTVILVDGDNRVEARLPTHLSGAFTKLAEGAVVDISGLNEQERGLLNGIADGEPLVHPTGSVEHTN